MKKRALVFLSILLTHASPCAANNTTYGTAAGAGITTATDNTLIGIQAGQDITTGTDNTLLGYEAGHSVTGNHNVILGEDPSSAVTSGSSNILIGNSLTEVTNTSSSQLDIGDTIYGTLGSGGSLTVAGALAAAHFNATSATTGYELGGNKALMLPDGDAGSIAVGVGALGDQSAAGSNTAMGYVALATITTGTDSAAIGYAALYRATGSPNTALGYQAGADITTGTDNTLVGYLAGGYVTGSHNIILGEDPDGAITSGSSNILIGNILGQVAAGSSNQIDIGDTILVPGDTHLAMHSTTPTQDGTSCGNSGFAISGNDNAMQITQGSTTSTTCKINFATTWANNAPLCTANFAGTTSVPTYITVSASTTILTLTFSATEASQKIIVLCMGYK